MSKSTIIAILEAIIADLKDQLFTVCDSSADDFACNDALHHAESDLLYLRRGWLRADEFHISDFVDYKPRYI